MYLYRISIEVPREHDGKVVSIETVDLSYLVAEILILPEPIDVMFVTCGPQPDPLHHFYVGPNCMTHDACIFYDRRCGHNCWEYAMNVCNTSLYMWPDGDCGIEAVFKQEGQPAGPWDGEYSEGGGAWETADERLLHLVGGVYYYDIKQYGLNIAYDQGPYGQDTHNKVARWREWRPTNLYPYEPVEYQVEARLGFNPLEP